MNPKDFLDRHQIAPRRSLGQNFLQDPNALEKVVASAAVQPDETVLEIGAGTGALTEALAKVAKRVIAVELDDRMLPILSRFEASGNVEIVHGDILELDLDRLIGEPYIVVANVPYYITSAILRLLLEREHKPSRIIMTVQTEVAERLVAKAGDMSVLAVSAQFYAVPKIVARFNAAVFYPRPDVGSAVIRLDLRETPPTDVPSEKLFFRVVRAGFGQKRKQLKNAIGEGLHLPAAEAEALLTSVSIDPRRRAETLTLDEWGALTRAFHAHTQSRAQPPG
ncbi:ribosomal RNA small subunit methyltransferase A [Anaerolineae bacterium CFX9]|jgi:16S rRNA (adenine1518-N6/adenine1519-N6)-dimethyltransferase|nr:ribosomal RNA small subunit methyltransferase A [Anaerolineae bacterium CFX9]